MAKFVILLCCFWLSLVAAGVLDDKWLRYGRIDRFDTVNDELDRDMKIVDITRMTGTELERQKILLKLLDHVHEGLNDVTFRMNLREEFDTNEGNYKKGMDDDMLYVIQALQNGRLLGKRDTFTITNVEHKRQMIGLKRLLTRAVDFKTFLQNALTARQHLNGVLFVNALLLAVREREDTRQLIVPAIYEILPELYIDRETLHTLKNIDINLLTTNKGLDTRRPQLSDLIGLGMRKQQRDDWSNLGRLVSVTRPRSMRLELDDKIVIDDVNKMNKIKTMKLLTEDVGFKGFLHQLLNDFCLKENELEKFELRGGRRVTDGSRRYGLDENLGLNYATRYGRNQYRNEYNRELPTTTIDDERLLHVNAKKLSQLNVRNKWLGGDSDRYQNTRDRFYDVVYDERRGNDLNRLIDIDERRTNNVGTRFMDISRRNRIDDGRRIVTTKDYDVEGQLNRLNDDCRKCIERKNFVDCQKCKRTTDVDVIDRLTKNCKQCIRDVSDDDCDKCKRLLDVNNVNLRFGRTDDSKIFGHLIENGRRTTYTSDYGVDRRQLQSLNTDCLKCIERKDFFDCQKCKRTTDVDVIERLQRDCQRCIRVVNDDDCDRCKDLIDNKDSMRFGQTDERRIFGKHIDDGRRTVYTNHYDDDDVDVAQLKRLNTDCLKCIERKNHVDCQKCKRVTDIDVIERLTKDCKQCIRDVNDYDCDKCKRKLEQLDDGTLMHQRFVNTRIVDGRRTKYMDDERHRGSLDFDEKYDIVDDVKDMKKGAKAEMLLHNLKQILVRLNLERMSLGLDTVTDVDVDDIRRKYTRNMMSVGLKNIDSQALIETIKSKIERKLNTQRSEVTTITTTDINIDRLIAEALIARTDSQDINMLDIISDIVVQSFGVGIDVGDMQIVRVIGEALDDTKILKMLNKIVKIVDDIRTDILGSYKRQELEFDDVQINDVIVDDLVTYIKQQDIELTNMLNVDTNKFMVVRQPQLDHKDFKIKIDLNSRRQQRVVMRMFLGPKKLVGDVGRRQINLNERRNDFILLDTNVIDLNVGRNLIEKRSRDLRWIKLDTTTLHKIYKKVMLTAGKVNKFVDDEQTKIVISDDCRFPKRLLLPRGNVMGLDLELLVIVTPIESYKVDMLVDDITSTKCTMGLSVKGVDRKSLGFPLDRHIDDSLDIRQLPNARIIDVKIFHDDDEERRFRGLY